MFILFFFLPDRPTHHHKRRGDGKRNILLGWPPVFVIFFFYTITCTFIQVFVNSKVFNKSVNLLAQSTGYMYFNFFCMYRLFENYMADVQVFTRPTKV